jgi:hypothetical protein
VIEISDHISDYSTDAAVGLFAIAPVTEGASLPFAGGALLISSIADGVSLGGKIIDAKFFGGSYKSVESKAVKMIVDFAVGKFTKGVLNKGMSKIIKKTNFKVGPKFRSAKTGKFIKNSIGFTIIASKNILQISISKNSINIWYKSMNHENTDNNKSHNNNKNEKERGTSD